MQIPYSETNTINIIHSDKRDRTIKSTEM